MAVVGRLSFADAPLNQAFVTQHWLMLGGVLVYVLAACCHPPLVAMDAEHDGAGGRPCGAR